MKYYILTFVFFLFCNTSLYSQNKNFDNSKIIRLNEENSKYISSVFEFDLIKKEVYSISAVSNYLDIKDGKAKYLIKNISEKDWIMIDKLLSEIDLSNYTESLINKEKFGLTIFLNNKSRKYITEVDKEVEILKSIFTIIRN